MHAPRRPGGIREGCSSQRAARGEGAGAGSGQGTRPGSARPSPPHSPEARAGSPGAAAPPGQRRRRRRLQRPRRGRIMRPRSWPGRSGPRGSERAGPAGPREGRRPRSTPRSPEPCLESTAARPPEVNPRGQRRRACAVQAAPGSRPRRGARAALSGPRRPGSLWNRGSSAVAVP